MRKHPKITTDTPIGPDVDLTPRKTAPRRKPPPPANLPSVEAAFAEREQTEQRLRQFLSAYWLRPRADLRQGAGQAGDDDPAST